MIKRVPSQSPPISVDSVPQFVTIGFDDNGHSGFINDTSEGMKWASDFFASLTNRDGSRGSCSFYYATKYITRTTEIEPINLVRKSWHRAYQAGHGVGCHTHSHSYGSSFSVDQWKAEIERSLTQLEAPYGEDENASFGIGASISEIVGFRTPFLDYNDNTFQALKWFHFSYDCSIEEGEQEDQDGTNFFWPYTLDEGSPGNLHSHSDTDRSEPVPLISPVAGLWEVPAHVVIVPDDTICEEYGIAKGFRLRMAEKQEYFDSDDGKITGLDYNLLVEFEMTKAEFIAVLKYTLDLRLQGNRAPFTFGGHSDVYTDAYNICPNITPQERREAVEEFFQYALTKPEVVVKRVEDIVKWLENPTPLS